MYSRHRTHFNRRSFKNIELVDDSQFTHELRQHLLKVYATLSTSIIATVIGAIAESYLQVAGILSTITLILGVISLFFIRESKLALPILYSVNFCLGTSLSILHETVGFEIITYSLLATVGIFVCFSVSALFMSRNTSFIYSSLFTNAILLLITLQIYNIFYATEFSVNITLYVSLFVVSLFVVYDTQLIMNSFLFGDKNFVLHSLLLYFDFLDIFIRICILLSKDKKKKK